MSMIFSRGFFNVGPGAAKRNTECGREEWEFEAFRGMNSSPNPGDEGSEQQYKQLPSEGIDVIKYPEMERVEGS